MKDLMQAVSSAYKGREKLVSPSIPEIYASPPLSPAAVQCTPRQYVTEGPGIHKKKWNHHRGISKKRAKKNKKIKNKSNW